MNRDEKNLISRQKILDSAFAEFGEQGYGRSSINTICTAGGISKGSLYHYFKDKDELYLTCVRTLFEALTAHLQDRLRDAGGTPTERLERYFSARLGFFRAHPLYQKLFCDVVVAPPPPLARAIVEIGQELDAFNIAVLTGLLQSVKLRADVSVAQAVETFLSYQDFVNARYQGDPQDKNDIEQREQTRRRSMDILLYGIVQREESE